MKARVTLSVVLVLMLTLLSAVSVSADGNTSQTATMIYNNTPVSGMLLGNHAGAYWYANIDNPGNENVVTIDMTFSPADPVIVKGVGFNLYSPSSGELIGSWKVTVAGLVELQFTSDKAEQLLLQVYNYIDNAQVNFTITAEGLPTVSAVVAESPVIATETAVAVVEEPVAVVEEPVAVVEEPVAVVEAPVEVVVPPLSGTLVGNAAGSFTRYSVTFDSADAVTLDMFYTPSDQLINKGVDFMVYGSDGEVDVKVATGTFGHIEATFTPVVGQKYLIQVENYIQDILISYNIHSSANLVSVTTGD